MSASELTQTGAQNKMITFEYIIKQSATLENGCVVYIYTPKIYVLYNGESVYFLKALADSVGKEYQGVCYRKCYTRDCINPDHLMFSKQEKFWSNVDVYENVEICWEWKSVKGKRKYASTRWEGRAESAHRIAYRLFWEDFPRELEVCHTCDNPSCCNPHHLFIGTHQENVDDREQKGRNKMPLSKGEEHGNHKLTEKQVLNIRELYEHNGHTYRSLGDIFNVSMGNIRKIIKKQTWGWLHE